MFNLVISSCGSTVERSENLSAVKAFIADTLEDVCYINVNEYTFISTPHSLVLFVSDICLPSAYKLIHEVSDFTNESTHLYVESFDYKL